jgi:CO/xanthine dehydrogenase FAD-binding subunit
LVGDLEPKGSRSLPTGWRCATFTPPLSMDTSLLSGRTTVVEVGHRNGCRVVNASRAGDTLPVLLAADAEIVLGSVRGERTAVEGDLWTADHAAAVLATELPPIDEVRSTAEYRRAVPARVPHRLLREEGDW